MRTQNDIAIEILQATNDGNDLAKSDLRVVEQAANSRLNRLGEEILAELAARVTKQA